MKTYKNIKDFRIYNKTLTFKIKDKKFRMKISSADVSESYYGDSPLYINVYVSANREVLLNFEKKYYKKEYKRMYENTIKEAEEKIHKFLEENKIKEVNNE